MPVNRDFRDLFAALNDAGAEFLVVGAHALAAHGHVRATKDIDVWIRADPENAAKVHRALDAFGAPLANLTPLDLAVPDVVFQIGVAPNRIDILTVVSGLTFGRARGSRQRRRRRRSAAGSSATSCAGCWRPTSCASTWRCAGRASSSRRWGSRGRRASWIGGWGRGGSGSGWSGWRCGGGDGDSDRAAASPSRMPPCAHRNPGAKSAVMRTGFLMP